MSRSANRGPRPQDPITRFWSKVNKTVDCWLWTGAIRNNGYGAFGIGSLTDRSVKIVQAHRFAWEITNGPIPEGVGVHGTCVLHRCDVRVCVNPDHLFLGSQADNMRDMALKGRGHKNGLKGEAHGMAKLSEDTVRKIRAYYEQGHTQMSTAEYFSLAQPHVSDIITRRIWKHVA